MTARSPLSALAIASLLSVACSVAFAGGARGLREGDKAPAFELKDQNGRSHSLAGLLKNGPVALVFFRSAKW